MHIKWHQEMGFAHDMPDDEWMAAVGAAQWVVLSQDRKFHQNEVEAQAVRQHRLRCFYLPNVDRWVTLTNFIRCHEKMMMLARTVPVPFIYQLRSNNRLYPIRL
jgi:hypothetical protein